MNDTATAERIAKLEAALRAIVAAAPPEDGSRLCLAILAARRLLK